MHDSPLSRYRPLAVTLGIATPTLITWIYFDLLAGNSVQRPAYLVGKVAQFGLPAVWVGLLLRQPLFEPKLPPSVRPRWSVRASISFGIGVGLAVAIAMFLIYRQWILPANVAADLSREATQRVSDLGFASPWRFVGLAMFYSLAHSLMEEYYYRWFVFGQLRQMLPMAPAICGCGLAFMAHHVIVLVHFFGPTPMAWFLSLCIAIGGGIWAWHYERSRSLLGPWLSHLIVDAGIFAIGYDLLFRLRP